jgi:hypothetical protein
MDIEPQRLRWKQVSLHELDTTHNVLNPKLGYQYVDINGEHHVESHVDYWTSNDCKNNELFVGRHLMISIQAPPDSTPIEMIGQDESVFSQLIFPTKAWIGPNQERGLSQNILGRV